MDMTIEQLNHTVEQLSRSVDQRFEQVDRRFEQMQHQFERDLQSIRQEIIDARVTTTQWVVGVFIGAVVLIGTVLGVYTALITFATRSM